MGDLQLAPFIERHICVQCRQLQRIESVSRNEDSVIVENRLSETIGSIVAAMLWHDHVCAPEVIDHLR